MRRLRNAERTSTRTPKSTAAARSPPSPHFSHLDSLTIAPLRPASEKASGAVLDSGQRIKTDRDRPPRMGDLHGGQTRPRVRWRPGPPVLVASPGGKPWCPARITTPFILERAKSAKAG